MLPTSRARQTRSSDGSAKRAQELVANVARFAAIEDLAHQSLDEFGNPYRTETRKYNYVASITESEPGYLAISEYRADRIATSDYPDKIASTGFAGLAFVFHPDVRDSFEMKCEGLGDWHGQATWLVHFRQRDDRPNRMHSYKVGNQLHPVKLKGRAWITSDQFQIVRMEAEMVGPMPEIELLSEHQVVEYGPIPFPKKNTTLWLPKSAEIYFNFRKHRYYRRHSFDHFMLFSVDTEEKHNVPVEPARAVSSRQAGCIIPHSDSPKGAIMKSPVRPVCLLVLILLAMPIAWSQALPEKIDLETISRIRYEGFHNSQVMSIATGLMDSIGERLTGSPNMKRANEWTRDKLTELGLTNAHLEAWGPFGRGWANQYVNARMTSPDIVPLMVYAKAWTPGTNGVVTGNVSAPRSMKKRISTSTAANSPG